MPSSIHLAYLLHSSGLKALLKSCVFLLFCSLFFIFPELTAAEARPLAQDDQIWMPVTLEAPVTKKLKLDLEVQSRLSRDDSFLSLLFISPYLTYEVNKHLSFTQGYYHSYNFQKKPYRLNTENRLWQMVTLSHSIKSLKINHQFRLEERQVENFDTMSVRFRYLIRVLYPLGKSKWSLEGSEEVFFNVNDVRQVPSGFNQNRIFVGLRRQLFNASFIEGGYMMQGVHAPAPNRNQLNHALLVRLNVVLPPLHLHKD
ncbi:MAG: DUF2490 domain-containing protein, partial [Cyanobacteria bacterium]|nr:DUF2490 domain-containing protein [Cyanobacteriota bacterium]